MMFIMQSDIVRQDVQRAVIRERLGHRHRHPLLLPHSPLLRSALFPLRENIMLSDEVSRARMQRAREEGAEDEIGQGAAAGVAKEQEVEGELGGDVEDVDARQGELVDEHGPQGVEEDLEGAEEGFAEDGV